jgi:hypothetical protein
LIFERPKRGVDEVGGINLDLSANMHDGYSGILTFCLPLAIHMGIKELYLLGCDCDYGIKENSSERSYFYNFKLHSSRSTSVEGIKKAWDPKMGKGFKAYEAVNTQLSILGIKIFNATDGGLLEVFPRIDYKKVLHAGHEPKGINGDLLST